MNSNLSAFRKENVLAIYKLIKQSGKLTRTEISKITSISLPTVTKIIDCFAESGMIRISNCKTNGKVSKCVSLHPEKYCIIFDFSSEKFVSHLVNLRGEIKATHICENLTYGPDRMIDEKADIHIKYTLEMVKINHKNYNCFGYGFLLPGHFDSVNMKVISPRYPQINRINFNKLIKDCKLDKTTVFCDIWESYANSIDSLTSSGQSSLMIYFDLCDISSALLVNGSSHIRLKYAPFGKAVIRDGHTLESICREIADPHRVAPIFAEEIFELSKKIPIENVFIVGNRYSPMPLFTKVVSEEFEIYRNGTRKYLPDIRFDLDTSSHISEIAFKIRDMHYLG